nr:MAG TPA: hypothetical protein [Caudoviricetes sp.]
MKVALFSALSERKTGKFISETKTTSFFYFKKTNFYPLPTDTIHMQEKFPFLQGKSSLFHRNNITA